MHIPRDEPRDELQRTTNLPIANAGISQSTFIQTISDFGGTTTNDQNQDHGHDYVYDSNDGYSWRAKKGGAGGRDIIQASQ